MTRYTIRVCPECGAQEQHFAELDPPTTYCLLHEDEPGRERRPAHVRIEVVRAS